MSPESGKEYLRRLVEQYQIARTTLPRLPEDEFERVRKNSAGKESGTESFLMDSAILAEIRRRNLERWATGRTIAPASAEHVAAVISALPSYTVASPEAMGAMRVEVARRFRIDMVAEDIIAEVAQRLPRTIDTYRYHQDYAHDTLDIPGLGEVKVTMHQTGDGIFTMINTVEGEAFKIWNCRASGVKYMDRYNDISRPNIITIKDSEGGLSNNAKTMEIDLYDEDNRTFVELDGKRFTNARWQTAEGRGYSSDWQRGDLHRTYSGGNDTDPRYSDVNKGWKDDKTVLSWKEVEEDAIVWLAENVLNPLKAAPKPESQSTMTPKEKPFPEGKVGPLYAFVEEQVLRKIALIKNNPGKAYPDERKAVRPNRELLSPGMSRGGAPKIVYDGFVWCGIGAIDEKTDLTQVRKIGLDYRWDDPHFYSQGVAVIEPKTAADVYVVDWQEWDDYRERTFTPTHDRLTDAERSEMHVVVARTLKPITEYDGSYKQPIVLIGRDLELDEVEAIYLPPQERRH